MVVKEQAPLDATPVTLPDLDSESHAAKQHQIFPSIPTPNNAGSPFLWSFAVSPAADTEH